MSEDLEITKSEYIDILKNRRKQVSSEINDDSLFKKVKYLKKRDLVHLATITELVFNELSLDNILYVLFKDVHKKKKTKVIDDIYKYYHKQKFMNLKDKIYRNLQKRQNKQIINDLKKLKRLKQSNLAKNENISRKELNEIRRLSDLPTKILRKLVQLRNVNSIGLKRSDLLHILMRTQKHHKEIEYFSHLEADPIDEIKAMIIKIKKFIIELGILLNKSERNNIRKRLKEIDKKRPNRS